MSVILEHIQRLQDAATDLETVPIAVQDLRLADLAPTNANKPCRAVLVDGASLGTCTRLHQSSAGGKAMNRRNLISAALPTAMAGAFLAGAGAAGAEPTETPVRRMFREWQPFSAWVNGPEGDSATEAEFDWIDRQRIALEDRMMAEPAQGPLDVLAKMIAWTHYGEDDLPPAAHLPQLWAEASTLLAHPASSA